jgi:XTP/dITP diphosphohydrolase
MTFSSNQKIVLASGTGSTFVENAIIKARNAASHCNLPSIADDSGLVVDALNGAPGVISARYAGVGATDQENLLKLLKDMEHIPTEQRTARFVCVIVFMRHAMVLVMIPYFGFPRIKKRLQNYPLKLKILSATGGRHYNK